MLIIASWLPVVEICPPWRTFVILNISHPQHALLDRWTVMCLFNPGNFFGTNWLAIKVSLLINKTFLPNSAFLYSTVHVMCDTFFRKGVIKKKREQKQQTTKLYCEKPTKLKRVFFTKWTCLFLLEPFELIYFAGWLTEAHSELGSSPILLVNGCAPKFREVGARW